MSANLEQDFARLVRRAVVRNRGMVLELLDAFEGYVHHEGRPADDESEDDPLDWWKTRWHLRKKDTQRGAWFARLEFTFYMLCHSPDYGWHKTRALLWQLHDEAVEHFVDVLLHYDWHPLLRLNGKGCFKISEWTFEGFKPSVEPPSGEWRFVIGRRPATRLVIRPQWKRTTLDDELEQVEPAPPGVPTEWCTGIDYPASYIHRGVAVPLVLRHEDHLSVSFPRETEGPLRKQIVEDLRWFFRHVGDDVSPYAEVQEGAQ